MSTTLVRIRVVTALVGLAIAAAGLPAWIGTSSAAAAGAAGDGSDWSSTGLSKSSSAVTVRWDDPDDKNPGADRVPRDGRQLLPHTGGQNYDAISGSVVSQYFDYFGKDNGLGGLKMTVSQTRDLVNQSVNLDISGVKGGAPFGIPSPVSLQVFQCWGGLTDSGKPDPGAADPDPATCQVGAGDPASHGQAFALSNSRYINSDPLVPGGDWDKYFNKGGKNDVPFTALTGTKSGSTNGSDNQFFNPATTNEVSSIQVSANGTATRQFEVQTSLESAGLGCGLRRGVTSTRSCWLVVVPRVSGVLDQNGPIAPSLWAQRLQVKLGFRDIVAGCPGGQSRTLTVGSELLSIAAASWTPGLCAAKNIALGYTQLGDPVARTEFQNGAADAVLTTQPADKPAYYVPAGLSAPVIAYALSYQPNCAAQVEPYTEEQAHTCGYASVADLDADILRSGTLVRNLKLDARLVAKLLTQSYAFSIFDQEGFRRSGWMVHRPVSIAKDPEFLRLNPDLAHISPTTSSVNSLDHLVLAALRSDAASAVWDWILKDPDGRAFLNGCPDPDGLVINPFYSTRTYQGCEDQRAALAAQADADRHDTPKPASYADLPVTYPPDGSPFPLPGWQEADVQDNPPYTVFDFLPRVDSMPVAGRDVAIGYVPRSTNLCLTVLDVSCQPAPGKWTDPKSRQSGDRLGVMAITTAATAARFQLPTAQLCSSDGSHCVGADAGSLTRAAARFVDGDAPGVEKPGSTDYAAGAYPLAQPVYVGVSKTLPQAEREAYADALNYVVTTGQKPGFAPGSLPPGYAPLPKSMLAQAKAAIAALRAGSGQTSTPGSSDGPGGTQTDAPADAPSAPAGGPTAAPVTDGPQAAPQFVTLAAGTEHWPKWPLPLGLGIALIAGLAGPLIRFRNAFQIG
ncbi:hypothetical protein [Nocardioides marmorisolisilvae]|uniref:PBP domain-containing protein n=1 Tax=Nocardioides marmorisolisilvae TaxID=1542737 RepID=A0A3N0DX12_9ACTN|nr:hypothetical protein [Nocardioides marmorisolisilvae]RNL79983.1 hypothetical protein EFL95_13765 [Nocardioides marmorisolisilvae]